MRNIHTHLIINITDNFDIIHFLHHIHNIAKIPGYCQPETIKTIVADYLQNAELFAFLIISILFHRKQMIASYIHYKIPHRFIGYIEPITESMKNSPHD